ncbi:MAG: response regulator [Planctomycetes bacterium]|nr:response regulator [Planctomycetota bacterium]
MSKTEILIVEDSPADIGLIVESLAMLRPRFRIHSVPNAPSALRFLYRLPPYETAITPDLMIIDLNMPMGDGFQLLEALHCNERTAAIRRVIFSSSSRQCDQDRAIALGAMAFFHKPLLYADFCDCVLRMVQQALNSEA